MFIYSRILRKTRKLQNRLYRNFWRAVYNILLLGKGRFFIFEFCERIDFTQWNFVIKPFFWNVIFLRGCFFDWEFYKGLLNSPKFCLDRSSCKDRWVMQSVKWTSKITIIKDYEFIMPYFTFKNYCELIESFILIFQFFFHTHFKSYSKVFVDSR